LGVSPSEMANCLGSVEKLPLGRVDLRKNHSRRVTHLQEVLGPTYQLPAVCSRTAVTAIVGQAPNSRARVSVPLWHSVTTRRCLSGVLPNQPPNRSTCLPLCPLSCRHRQLVPGSVVSHPNRGHHYQLCLLLLCCTPSCARHSVNSICNVCFELIFSPSHYLEDHPITVAMFHKKHSSLLVLGRPTSHVLRVFALPHLLFEVARHHRFLRVAS